MRVDLTIEQVDALDNELYAEDDRLREYPIPDIVDLGQVREGQTATDEGTLVGYAFAHPKVTWEDEVVMKFILDERAAELQAIKDAPQEDRAGMRQTIRQRIRQDARKAARVAQRQADRRAARQEMRQDLRQEARIAARIAERKAEREAAAAAESAGT